MPIIEPRMLGLLPDGVDKATFFVADKSNVERRIFDTDGELYTPDGQTVDDRLNAVEAGIPPLDDARIVALEGAMLTAQGDIIVAEADIATAEGDIVALQNTVGAEQLLLDQAQADIVNIQGDIVTAQADIITANNNSTIAANSVNAHIADLANPHVVTRAQIGAEATGTAASAIATHVALADPHTQYLKESATASEVEALPLNDANNYFTGTTIGDQMQEAGAIIQPFADHVANVANPHTVTATQVGLSNVTNESKATMFTSPTFTGVPLAPTAVVGTDTTQVATTAFVNDSIDAITGADIPIVDAGTYFATDNVEAALQSVGSQLGQITPYNVLTTAGDIIFRNATVPARLAKGLAKQFLRMNVGATAPEWVSSPYCLARKNGSALQSIANAEYTAITFADEVYDTDNIHSIEINPERLTCKTAGTYLIFGAINFFANATGSRTARIKLNDTTEIGFFRSPSPTLTAYVQVFALRELAVNDYLVIEAYQDSGSSLNVQGYDHSPVFGMVRLN